MLGDLSVDQIRIDIAPRPETWSEICGWYSPAPGPVTNLALRALMGAGPEVVVQGGHLMLKPLTPIPAMRRGFRLYPDDSTEDGTATRLLLDMRSFQRRPDFSNPRPWVTGGLAVGTAAVTIRSILHHRGSVGT